MNDAPVIHDHAVLAVMTDGAIRAARSVLAPLGYDIARIEFVRPARIWLRRRNLDRRGMFSVYTTAGSREVCVEEPYPEFFPSEVFLQRVMLLA